MPHGNIEDPMKRSSSGDSVEACGPLLWDGDNLPAKTITIDRVEVKQRGVDAESNPNLTFKRGQAEWMVKVHCSGSERFQDGPAKVEVQVTVLFENGKTKKEQWNRTVQIIH